MQNPKSDIFRKEIKEELKEYFDFLYEDIKELKSEMKDLKNDIHSLRGTLNELNISRIVMEKGLQDANATGESVEHIEQKLVHMESQVKALKLAGMFIATFFAIVSAISGDLKGLFHLFRP